jgi:hypothetical protein
VPHNHTHRLRLGQPIEGAGVKEVDPQPERFMHRLYAGGIVDVLVVGKRVKSAPVDTRGCAMWNVPHLKHAPQRRRAESQD